jgi:hypothetical protein
MDSVQTEIRDERSANDKTKYLMDLIPINTFWHKVTTSNRPENKVLSYLPNDIVADDETIITTHSYFWVYGYESHRDNGWVGNQCVEIKWGGGNWSIYPESSIYDFQIQYCTPISKEEFNRIEKNFIDGFSQLQNYDSKFLLINNKNYKDKEKWWEDPHILKKFKKNNTLLLCKDTISFDELKIGDKYIFWVTKNALRMGEITGEIENSVTEKKNFSVIDRQIAVDQDCQYLFSESSTKRKLFVLISQLTKSNMENYWNAEYFKLTDEEWTILNKLLDELKKEFNECINSI